MQFKLFSNFVFAEKCANSMQCHLINIDDTIVEIPTYASMFAHYVLAEKKMRQVPGLQLDEFHRSLEEMLNSTSSDAIEKSESNECGLCMHSKMLLIYRELKPFFSKLEKVKAYDEFMHYIQGSSSSVDHDSVVEEIGKEGEQNQSKMKAETLNDAKAVTSPWYFQITDSEKLNRLIKP